MTYTHSIYKNTPPLNSLYLKTELRQSMGWVGLEPTVYNLWLKARSVRRYGNHPIKGLDCQGTGGLSTTL